MASGALTPFTEESPRSSSSALCKWTDSGVRDLALPGDGGPSHFFVVDVPWAGLGWLGR